MVQFSYNLQKNVSLGTSPFVIATGQQPTTLHTLGRDYKGSLTAFKFAKGWQVKADMERVYLVKYSKKMKK